jgi:hypothetical protein
MTTDTHEALATATARIDTLLESPIPTGRTAMLAHRDQLVVAVAELDAAVIDDLESRIAEA